MIHKLTGIEKLNHKGCQNGREVPQGLSLADCSKVVLPTCSKGGKDRKSPKAADRPGMVDLRRRDFFLVSLQLPQPAPDFQGPIL